MKKIVVIILGLSLLIGVPLMILDVIGQTKDVFTIPSNYDKVIVDLSEESRTEELLHPSKNIKHFITKEVHEGN